MDLQTLKKEHPEIVLALSADIVAGLTKETLQEQNPTLVDTLTAAGREQERERIANVRAQSIPGHEALIARLELDGVSTGAEAAKAIVAAEREARKLAADAFTQDGNPAAPMAGDPDSSGGKTMKREAFSKLPPTEQGQVVKSGVRIID